VTTAQRALVTAQRQVVTQQQTIIDAQNQVATQQIAQQQAQLNLQTAQFNLSAIADVEAQQNIINYDNYLLQFIIPAGLAQASMPGANPNEYSGWMNEESAVNANLAAAQKELNAILAEDAIDVPTTVELQVANYQLAIKSATLAITTANQTLEEANTTLTNAQDDLSYYQQGVTIAQSNLDIANEKETIAQQALDEANADSPNIASPIDGFVTQINIAAGSEVYKGAIILEVADPNQFEANILVSEMNISQVRLGGSATVTADAFPGVTWSANVTQIAPTATISSGVVNYSIDVEVGSIIPTAVRNQAANATSSSGNATSNRAFTPSGNFTLPQGFSGGAGNFRSRTSSTGAQNVQLKEGMTVTVSIIVSSQTNVLVVPNGAITTQGNQSYVQVILPTGALEKRAVQTGLSDLQNTEITSGLTEGEKISTSLGTSSIATPTNRTTTPLRPGGGAGIFLGR
jgi:multidrug efflux pump subunit AcrA (membrane-fusion protein)